MYSSHPIQPAASRLALFAAEQRRRLRPVARRIASLVTRQRSKLEPERILAEYRRGRFPTAGRLGVVGWHDPERRAIVPLDERFHVPSDARKLMRNERFTVTFDQAFSQVIHSCAEVTPGRQQTWISADLVDAYISLHRLGHAHSVEVWFEDRLVGGGYGLTINGLFSGESMFSREKNASKLAMVHLHNRLRERGFVLNDAQIVSNFSRQFGVIEISRDDYLQLLAQALVADARFA